MRSDTEASGYELEAVVDDLREIAGLEKNK
jgi:hypothetical protein